MNVTTEKNDNQQVVLTITVEAAEFSKAYNQACKRLANRVNIPGFRKGKAPKNILIRHIGKEAVEEEAFDIAAPKALDEAYKETGIIPVTRPQADVVTVEEGKDLVFKVTVTPRPEVTLGEYKGLKIAKEKVEITEEQVDKRIEGIQDRYSKMVDAAEGEAVKTGDFITLDFKGFVDGEAFEGGEGKDHPLQIGSNSFIPGFEDQLIGTKVGDEVEVKVTFPADYHAKDLAGKEATFQCKVNSLKHKELPEADDELAKKASKFETMAEFRADLKATMQKTAENKADSDRRNAAITQATENTTVEIPEVMIENRIDMMLQEMSMRLEQQGMKMEQYLQYAGVDMAKLRADYREEAAKSVKTDLMLEDVAKAENIQVTGEDLDREVAMLAATYGATVQQVQKIIKEQNRIADLAATVLKRKTAKFITDSITE